MYDVRADGGGGSKIAPNLRRKSIDFEDKENGNPKIGRTSSMEAPPARDLMKISRKATPRHRSYRKEGAKSHLLSEKFPRRGQRERGGRATSELAAN